MLWFSEKKHSFKVEMFGTPVCSLYSRTTFLDSAPYIDYGTKLIAFFDVLECVKLENQLKSETKSGFSARF